MPLTQQQRIDRLSIRSDNIKTYIRASLRKECDKKQVVYNESDTNAQLCEKLNNAN